MMRAESFACACATSDRPVRCSHKRHKLWLHVSPYSCRKYIANSKPQWRKAKMVRLAAVTAVMMLFSNNVFATGVGNAQWGEHETASPAQAPEMLKLDPHGRPRGTRSAATLFAEARNAARAGRDDEAIAWLLLCQSHNAGAQTEIRADRAAVLSYLK